MMMQKDHMQEPSPCHDLAADSAQPEPPSAQKKPFMEPTLSQSVSLPDVTAGSFVGTVSF